jgi:hypothetical protein
MSVSAIIKKLSGKALIEENGSSLVKVNNDARKPLKLTRCGHLSKTNF